MEEQQHERHTDDTFGLCPECKMNDGYLDIGRAHWFVCHVHRKKWFHGFNCFASWRVMTPADTRRNHETIAGYEEIMPWHYPVAPYRYCRAKDGCDETWDILGPGDMHIASLPFWEAANETKEWARFIVAALNHFEALPPEQRRRALEETRPSDD